MKQCSACKIIKDLSFFPKNKHSKDGLHNACKECRRAINKKWREDNREHKKNQDKDYRIKNPEKFRQYVARWRLKSPEKVEAHAEVKKAIQDGILKPQSCLLCGSNTKIEGHHPCYSKPLEVIWVCRSCHKVLHKKSNKDT